MINRKGLLIGILLMGGALFLTRCTLDDPGATSSDPPLNLQAGQNLSLITLNWDLVKVTGFKEYVLLQSTSDIPNSPTPVVNSETIVLKRIDDVDKHSFTFTNTLFAPRLCFKVYASVNDRFIYSSTLCLDQDFVILNGFNDRAGHEEGLDKVILFDRVNTRFSTLDYKTANIDNSVLDNNLNFPLIDVSTYQGTTDVFAYDQSPASVIKYRYPDLALLTYKDFNGVLFALQTHQQYVFIASDDVFKGFQVLNRNNFTMIDSKPGISGNRNIAVFDGSPLVVLEIGENTINKYSIDLTGKIIKSSQLSYGVNQINAQNTIANSNDYYIGGRLGVILDKEANIVGTVATGANSFVSMIRFSPDRSKVVSIISDNAGTRLVINDVSGLPAISMIASYDAPAANYADLIVEDHTIYVIGVTFASGQSQTFILKYPI